jgi:Uma2 family endonuclease
MRPLESIHTTYPSSDGKPMSESTEQFDLIVYTKLGLEHLFAADPQVLVVGDLLWYPREGMPQIRRAADVMVVFGRPKGPRKSYLQWLEGDVAPQVVFEFISAGNYAEEMLNKFVFYENYGVEEYYTYDPATNALEIWLRQGKSLSPVAATEGWVSPRLRVRFSTKGGKFRLSEADHGDRPFQTFVEAKQSLAREQERAAQEYARAELLAQKLRELGIDPDTL